MKDDLDAILQFLEQPNTDYAYMVTGAWGAGKTHFWKHVVAPRLQKSVAKEDPPTSAYVSLYGIKGPDELGNAVLAQLHPRIAQIGKWAGIVGPTLLRWMKVEIPATDVAEDLLNRAYRPTDGTQSGIQWLMQQLTGGRPLIICFDDLERTTMPIDVVLGHINQYVEHARAKVVILCNEAELDRKFGPQYRRTKEKLVRVTRVFRGDPLHALPAIIGEFAGDAAYHDYLKTNRELVSSILSRSKLRNLRVLKHALLTLQTAFNEFRKQAPGERELHLNLITTLLPVTFDLERRKLTRSHARQFLTGGSSAIMVAYMGMKDGKRNPLAAFGSRYGFGGVDRNLIVSPALAELVTKGYLDAAKVKREIEDRRTARTPGRESVKALMRGWYGLSDDVLPATVKAALGAVRAGEVDHWSELFNLGTALDWMGTEGAGDASNEAIKLAFDEGIELLARTGRFASVDAWRAEHEIPDNKANGEVARHVRTRLIEMNSRLADARLKSSVDEAFAGLEEDADRFARLISERQGNGIGIRPIVHFIPAKEFLAKLLSASNDVRHAVGMGIRRRYNDEHDLPKLVADIPWLMELSAGLERRLKDLGTSMPVAKLNLTHIKQLADEAVTALKGVAAVQAPPAASQ